MEIHLKCVGNASLHRIRIFAKNDSVGMPAICRVVEHESCGAWVQQDIAYTRIAPASSAEQVLSCIKDMFLARSNGELVNRMCLEII